MKKRNIIIIAGTICLLAILVCVFLLFINKKYTVTFITDGNIYKEVKVKSGAYVGKPSDPTKNGYTFIEWQYKSEKFDFKTPIKSDITLNALWKEIEDENKITVTFDTDGGTIIESQIIEKGQKVSKPLEPTKEGYVFKGWFVDSVEFDFDDILEEDITIKAKWEEDTKQQSSDKTSNTNGQTNNKSSNNQANSNGTNVSKPVKPTLATPSGGEGFFNLSVVADGAYADDVSSIKGWELSEKVNGTYTKYGEYSNFNAVNIKLEPGQTRTFKARVYVLDSKGNKVYSGYSNEISKTYN